VLTLAAPTGGGEVTAAETMTPLERLASTPKGQLNSPYQDLASVVEEGHRKYTWRQAAMAATAGAAAGAWPRP
jgi:hypothetical protein